MYQRPEILEKLITLVKVFEDYIFAKQLELPTRFFETLEHLRLPPDPTVATPIASGTTWGQPWGSAWFFATVDVPEELAAQPLYLRARTGGVETLLWVNGHASGIFTDKAAQAPAIKHQHHTLRITPGTPGGSCIQLALESYAGHNTPGSQPYLGSTGWAEGPQQVTPQCRKFQGLEVVTRDDEMMDFVFDLHTLTQLASALPDSSFRKGKLRAAMPAIFALLPQMPHSFPWEQVIAAVARARALMSPLLSMSNGGGSVPRAGLIGHSHIDTAWHWPVKETIRKCARTFANVLSLMEQYPEYRFVQSSPVHADFMRLHYPGIFEGIRARVQEGRWEPNGGCWVEFDANLPGGESMVRQFLRGQRFTREHFNYTADTFWLPDTFGYSAALPQILRGVGIKYFLTTKIEWGNYSEFPHDSFYWKGLDGSRVLVHLNTMHCPPDAATIIDNLHGKEDRRLPRTVRHKDLTDRRLIAFGYGDGGGGPDYSMLEMARRVRDVEGCPAASHTTVSAFMAELEQNSAPLPTWSGELYVENHRGCLTQLHDIKRLHRKAEFALREAEILLLLSGSENLTRQCDELAPLWDLLLLNEFHDILPGTCIQEAHVQAVRELGQVVAGGTRLSRSHALNGVDEDPAWVTIWNTMGWPHKTALLLRDFPEGLLPAGEGIQSQWISTLTGEKCLAIQGLAVPALGATSVALRKSAPQPQASVFRYIDRCLETPFARVQFDEQGAIASFVDLQSGRQLRGGGAPLNTLYMGEDVPTAWDNWNLDEDQELKMLPQTNMEKEEVTASGPVQFRIRRTYRLGPSSSLTQEMVFHADSPRVDFETLVDWKDPHHFLKVGFDLALTVQTMRNEVQFGHLERPTHQNTPADRGKFEVCNQKWTALSENRFGVAMLNDGKYGLSCRESDLRLSLHKGGTHPDGRGDVGQHVMNYALLPYVGAFSAETVVRAAYEFNQPPTVVLGKVSGKTGQSLLSVDAGNLVVEAIKPATDFPGEWIIRLYEAERSAGHAKLQFHRPLQQVMRVDLLEQDLADLPVNGNGVEIAYRAFEIISLKVRFG